MKMIKKIFHSLVYRMPILSSLIVTMSLLILAYSFSRYEKIIATEHNKQSVVQQSISFNSFSTIWKRDIYSTFRNFSFSSSGKGIRVNKFDKEKWEDSILEFMNTLHGVFGVERIGVYSESIKVLSDYNPFTNSIDEKYARKFSQETFENDEVQFKFLKVKDKKVFLFSQLIDSENGEDRRCIVLYLNHNKFIAKFSQLYGHKSVLVSAKNRLLKLDQDIYDKHTYNLRKTLLNTKHYPQETWVVSYIIVDSIISLIEKEKFKLKVIMIILIIFSLIFSFLITYKSFLPVKHIMKTIENFSNNNYVKEFDFKGNSEINFIGSKLNQLIDSVNDSKTKEQEMNNLNEHLMIDLKQKIVGLNITALMSETDLKGRIIDCNDRFCEISKYSREELVGKDHRLLNSGYHTTDFWVSCWKEISNGNIWKEEVCNKDKEGNLYWVLTTIFPTKNLENIVTGFSSIRIDITAQKELEQEKQKASKSEKLASLGELSAGIGHEINNPLAINIGNVRLLKRELSSGVFDINKVMGRLDKLTDSNERIRKIVDGLRTFARGDSGVDEVVSLRVAIDQTVNLVSEIYEREGITINDLTPDYNLSTLGNLGKVQQIIMNLISNARDATEGQDARQIDISLEEKDDKFLVLNIKDNGVGISEEIRDKILQPFFTTKDVGQGTGMGLGIVIDFIQNMGGELVIDSTPGEGSIFTVVLLLCEEEMTKSKDLEEDKPIDMEKKEIGDTESTRIALVVDDEEDIREILMDYLDDMGIECHEADDGDSAIEMVLKNKYDYIFTDMKMARMQGDEFIKESRNGDTRYFIVTGGVSTNTTVQEREELYNLAEAYIDKPFSPETIAKTISKKIKKVS